jgi:Ni/Co efflux regulator RcnB
MKAPVIASILFAIAVSATSMQALADDRDNHQFVRHDEWKKGAKIKDEDWNRGEHIDYRQQHLRTPPHGYEWRLVDGNYVLAAVATGVISSVIAASVAAHQ